MERIQTHKTYGLVTGIVMCIFSIGLYVAGLSFKPGMQYVTYIPFLAGIIMNAVAYSKANDGFVTFGNVFSSGFKASAIIALIIMVMGFVMMAVFPEMKEKAIEMAREQMESKGDLSEEMIDKSIEWTRKYWTLFMVAGSIFGMMFWGALFSLIGAAVAKKKGERNPMMPV